MYRLISYLVIFSVATSSINAYSSSKIGFLAPLSGKYAQFGERVLRGASIAADLSDKTIIAADNRGVPLYSKYQLKWLIDQGIKKVVGPIFYINAKAVEKILKKYDVIAVSLSKKTEEKNLISLSVTSRIADLLATFVMLSGSKSVRIIYPAGKNLKSAIAKRFYSVTFEDNRFVKLSSFDSNSSDLSTFVKNSFDIHKEKDRYSCDLPDLVFLDTSISNGEKLLSLFKYYECMPKTVLVLPFWYDNSVLRFDSSLVKNVVIGSVFYKNRGTLSKQFFDRFSKEFGYEPTIIEVVGFDMAFYLIHDKTGKIQGISTLLPDSGPKNLIFLKIKEHQFVKANIQDK